MAITSNTTPQRSNSPAFPFVLCPSKLTQDHQDLTSSPSLLLLSPGRKEVWRKSCIYKLRLYLNAQPLNSGESLVLLSFISVNLISSFYYSHSSSSNPLPLSLDLLLVFFFLSKIPLQQCRAHGCCFIHSSQLYICFFLSLLPTFYMVFWEISTLFLSKTSSLLFFSEVIPSWVFYVPYSSWFQFPQNIFSISLISLFASGNIPCLKTKANKILFSMFSHKIIKCYFFLLLPIYKEFLCLGFLFSSSPFFFVH